MGFNDSSSLFPLLMEFRKLREDISLMVAYFTPVKCRACGSYFVVPIKVTEKRVRFFCKNCGEEFQVSKEKLEKIRNLQGNSE